MTTRPTYRKDTGPIWFSVMIVIGLFLAYGNAQLPPQIRDLSLGPIGLERLGQGLVGLGVFLLFVNRIGAAVRGAKERKKSKDRRQTIQRRKIEGSGVNYGGRRKK